MSQPSGTSQRDLTTRQRLPEAVALLLATLPVWIYVPLLEAPLLDADAFFWSGAARLREAGGLGAWLEHLVGLVSHQHFIGYRPITALSFLIGTESGQEWLIHGMDLLLFAGILGLLYRIARRGLGLSPTLALLVTWVLGLHPICESILPRASSRNDLLVALAALGYVERTLCGTARGRSLWLLLALGSKEPAVVLPLALLATEFQFAPGPWREKARRSLRHAAPDLVILIAFASLRFLVLGHLGGYENALFQPRPLIPAAYFATLAVPLAWSPALGEVARVFVVLGASLLTWWACRRSPSRCLVLVLFALLFEMLLHVHTGLLNVRMLMMAAALWCVLVAERAARGGRSGRVLLLALGLPSALLFVLSRPWQSLTARIETVTNYTGALARVVEQLPRGESNVYLADLPHRIDTGPLQLANLSVSLRSAGPGRLILPTAILVRLLRRSGADGGRRLRLHRLGTIFLEQPEDRWWLTRTDAPAGTLTLQKEGDYAVRWVFHPNLPTTHSTDGLWCIDLRALDRGTGRDHLFVFGLEEGVLLPLPALFCPLGSQIGHGYPAEGRPTTGSDE